MIRVVSGTYNYFSTCGAAVVSLYSIASTEVHKNSIGKTVSRYVHSFMIQTKFSALKMTSCNPQFKVSHSNILQHAHLLVAIFTKLVPQQ